MPKIVIDHSVALRDTPIHIRVTDCPPGRRLEITAEMRDGLDQQLRSWAVFEADQSGTVDLRTQAPVSGSYGGVSGMGLFWSMDVCSHAASTRTRRDLIGEGLSVDFHVDDGDGGTEKVTVRRIYAEAGVSHRKVRSQAFAGDLCMPPGPGPHPAIVVLTESGGGNNPLLAAILASRGYAALALGYHNMEGVPEFEDTIPLEYFERVFSWLRALPEVDADFLAVMGRSRGGELALLLGATFPEISAVVGYAASGVIYGGFERVGDGFEIIDSAWSFRGENYLGLLSDNRCHDEAAVDWSRSPVATTPRFLSGLRDLSAVERATIPVENIKGPVLLVSGAEDQMWASVQQSEIAIERLRKFGHPYPYEHLVYEGAGHFVTQPYVPLIRRSSYSSADDMHYAAGGTPAADARAAEESWPKVLEFLRRAHAAKLGQGIDASE